jgi:DNA-binding NarL/FixJ family response regulator
MSTDSVEMPAVPFYPNYVYMIIRSILDEEINLIEGFEAGADEYLSKQTSPAQLLALLKTAQRILSLEHALKRMISERRKMALTGAFNRRYFMKYAQRNVQRAQSCRCLRSTSTISSRSTIVMAMMPATWCWWNALDGFTPRCDARSGAKPPN